MPDKASRSLSREAPFVRPGRAGGEVHPGSYDGIFHCYGAANTLLTLGLDALWRKTAAAAALAGNPSSILDVCCGDGSFSAELSRRSRGGTSVTGLDFSEKMLSAARKKSPHIPFILGDAARLPFPEASFDALTLSFAARNLAAGGAELGVYFKEFLRVIKPGGVFVNLETSRPENAPLRAVFHAYVRAAAALAGLPSPAHRSAYSFLSGSIAGFYPPEKLSGIMLEAGFASAEARPLMFGALAVHRAVKGLR